MRSRAWARPLALALLAAGGFAGAPRVAAQEQGSVDWPAYGGGPANIRYSPLDQIDRGNVGQLVRAWEYRTGTPGEMQCQPIVVDAVLYCTTARLEVFALRADTGEEIWRFDPFAGAPPERPHVNRGVVYWEDGEERRIFFTAGPRLYALDARSGEPDVRFGEGGSVDLRTGLGERSAALSVVATSPGAIYRNLLIQGTRVSEAEGAAPGHVRAFDARTGAVRWTFHTIPQAGEAGVESWPEGAGRTAGGANSWAGISVDTAQGIAYVPTGSATPDFYGGGREGANLYANSLLALDAATGERIWHFQAVHHDIWDRDLPAPPNLIRLEREGRPVDAVAQITKSGHVFVFDRQTGEPLFPIEERPVAPSDLAGEVAWPTQPLPVRPPPFARQRFTEEEVTDISPEAHAAVLARLRTLRSGGQFVPPSVEGTVILPGFDGGGEWGGAAFDPETGLLYVNANEMAWVARMIPESPEVAATESGSATALYGANCAGCHGADRAGTGDRGPSLRGVGARRTVVEIHRIVREGAGFMPPFAHLPEAQRDAIVQYLLSEGREVGPTASPVAAERSAEGRAAADAAPYRFAGYERFLDPEGYPAVRPPWGTLSAIDLERGEIRWQVPLGEFAELTARGIPPTGTENYGGPVVTAGGLVFIAATRDRKLRAFDKETGEVLWAAELPAGGYATPSVYAVEGRQYVVVAAGGGKMGTEPGDSYVAYALPPVAPRPNILVAIADDASYPHFGAYGANWVETPSFDRVAREGILFLNAYTPNAKCAPSRSSILTGRNSWQLGAAANHWPYFPEEFLTYTEALRAEGYRVGYTGKGWGPGIAERDGEPRQLTGEPYNRHRLDRPTSAISAEDYAANFGDFLDQLSPGEPFSFWYGAREPHRAYEYGSGARAGKTLDQIGAVYPGWPDNETVRNDLLDYALEVEHFDRHLGRMLDLLEQRGLLDNTIVVVTADNGMPFPRIKGQTYELSNHMPLAIMWPRGIPAPGRTVADYVSFIDFAPTFLEVAGIEAAASGMQPMAGRSLTDVFRSSRSGQVTATRDHVLLGKERHDVGRPGDVGYPVRGIVADGLLYLRNYAPERWPAGNPETGYLNVDGGPTKTEILRLRREGIDRRYWDGSFGRRPPEELYDLHRDPQNMHNLAADPALAQRRDELAARMEEALRVQADPRVLGRGDLFDRYPYADPSGRGFYERYMAGEDLPASWVEPTDFEPEPIP